MRCGLCLPALGEARGRHGRDAAWPRRSVCRCERAASVSGGHERRTLSPKHCAKRQLLSSALCTTGVLIVRGGGCAGPGQVDLEVVVRPGAEGERSRARAGEERARR